MKHGRAQLLKAFRRAAAVVALLAASLAALAGLERFVPASPNATASIPFDFERNSIVLTVDINGRGPYRFLLDTGTDPSVLDLSVADSVTWFQVPLGARGTGAASKQVQISLPPPVRVSIAGLRTRRLIALSADLSGASERLGRPLHGVLGYNFLKRYRLEIDYRDHTIRFLPGDAPWTHPLEAEAVLDTMVLLGNTFPLLASVAVNGTPIKSTLDTGSNQGISLYAAAVELLDLVEVAENAGVETIEGFGGEMQIRSGAVDRVSVGHLIVDSVPASFVLTGPNAATPLTIRGANVGNTFLQHFVVGLDYRRRQIMIYRPSPVDSGG